MHWTALVTVFCPSQGENNMISKFLLFDAFYFYYFLRLGCLMFISTTCQLSLQAVPPCNCIRPSDIRLYYLTRLSARSPVVAAAWRVFSPPYILSCRFSSQHFRKVNPANKMKNNILGKGNFSYNSYKYKSGLIQRKGRGYKLLTNKIFIIS